MLRTILLEPLFNILLFIYAIVPGAGFGVAIIILTVIIRLAMWPLVKKQLHHQQAMKELQPEIAKIKKKAKGNKQKESEMMMELFKEKEINPFSSIGLALVQFPILIALFFVLRDIVVAANIPEVAYGFIQSFPAVLEIINNPDTFDPTLFGYFHMADPSIILAAVAGLAQYAQAKQITPQNMFSTDPNKKSGFNFVLFLPVITVAVASQLPSALALYWATSSLVAVIQQHIVLEQEVTIMQKLGLRKKSTTSQPANKEAKATNQNAPKPKKKAKPKPKKKAASKAKTKKG